MIREARPVDLDAIEKIYDNIHAAEESGKAKIGWISGNLPVKTDTCSTLVSFYSFPYIFLRRCSSG